MASGIVLGFDFGLRKMGVAVGNWQLRTATPLSVLPAKRGVLSAHALQSLLQTWRPEKVVVGLPLNMDDTEDEISEAARAFAESLAEAGAPSVVLWDERLSTFEAKQRAKAMDRPADKAVDALAAAVILESYLEANEPERL